MELLKDLIQRMNPIEFVCAFNMSSRNLREELRHIQELIEKFECKVKRDPIDIANVDDYVDKVRNLLKQVLNSQVYKAYIDYNSRLKISREITRKLEEGDQENELRFISSQFYLKIKEREMESREKLVNSITQEFTQRITQMDDKIKKLEKGEKESDKKINEINNTIEKNAKSTLRNFKELKEKTNESFENVQKNNELSLNKISQKLNEETKQIEEVKENQEKLKVILENSEKNQEKLEKNQGKLEKNQGNFDKKIKQFANKQGIKYVKFSL